MGLIFTYLCFILGVCIGPFRPYYGFLLYVLFAIIKPEHLWHWSVPASSFSWWIAISFLTGWFLQGCGSYPRIVKRQAQFGLGYLFALAVCAAVSPVGTNNFIHVVNAAKIIIPAIAGMSMIQSRDDLTKLIWIIIAGLGMVSFSLNESYFSGKNRLLESGFGGMDNNSFCVVLATGIGFCAMHAFENRSRVAFYFPLAASGLLAHCCLFSMSRGAMLGVLTAAISTWLFAPKNRRNVSAILVAAIVTIATTGTQVQKRFFSIQETSLTGEGTTIESSAESRILLTKACFQIWIDHPLTGVGPGNFGSIVSNYPVSGSDGSVVTFPNGKRAHNLWAQTFAELGLLGVFFYLGFFLIPFYTAFKTASKAKHLRAGRSTIMHATMSFCSLATFFVTASFVSVEGAELPYYVAAFCIAGQNLLTQDQRIQAYSTAPEAQVALA